MQDLGFAVMSTTLDNVGHNCNLVTEACSSPSRS
jgi:hypothetical protein